MTTSTENPSDFRKKRMSSDICNCCRCAAKAREGRHDFSARVGDEIVVIKDVPALICDTCGEVEYTLEVSREIDLIMKEFFDGKLLAQSPWLLGRSCLRRSVRTRRYEPHLRTTLVETPQQEPPGGAGRPTIYIE